MICSAMPASGGTQVSSAAWVAMLGVGVLRPNISAVVGGLYPQAGPCRDAGAGMLFDLVQPGVTGHYFGERGLISQSVATAGSWTPVVILALASALLTRLALDASPQIDPSVAAVAATWMFSTLALGYFGYLRLFAGLEGDERRRVYVMLGLSSAVQSAELAATR